MQKKILYLFIAALLIATAFLGGYLTKENTGQGRASLVELDGFSSVAPSPLPKFTLSSLENVTFTRVDSFTVNSETKITYSTSGNIRALDLERLASEDVRSLPKTSNILWSPDKTSLIYSSINSAGVSRAAHLDLGTGLTSLLHPSIRSISFSPSGEKIAYHFFDEETGEGNISISEPDGENFVVIAKTRLPSIKISWPQANIISFYTQTSADEITDLFLLNTDTRQLKKVLESKKGLDALWSPGGRYLLYSSFEDGRLALMATDTLNWTASFLDVATFASKCAWNDSESFIICGVPDKEPEKPTRPFLLTSKDSIVRLDLGEKNSKTMSLNLTEDFQVLNPIISSLEKNLFFINGLNGQLYRFLIN